MPFRVGFSTRLGAGSTRAGTTKGGLDCRRWPDNSGIQFDGAKMALRSERCNRPQAAACFQKCLSKSVTDKTIVLPSNPSGNGDDAQYRLTVMAPKRRYLSYLRERWWVVMLCLAVAVSAVVTYETVRPESYTSYVQLYITEGPQLAASVFGMAKDDFATQIELLKGERLQAAAVADLGADANRLKNPINVEVVRPMDTSILQLRATGQDPALTQHFLQALLDEYLAFKRQTQLSSSEDVVNSLTEQLSLIEKDLQADQDKWTAFQRANNVALLQEESQSAAMSLGDQSVQLANLNLQLQMLELGLTPSLPPLSTNAANTNLSGSMDGTGPNNNLGALTMTDASIKTERVDLMLRQAELAQTLTNGPEYKVKPLQDQVAQIQQNLAALEAVDAAQRQAELKDTEERITAISNAIPVWKARIADSSDRLAQGTVLKAAIQRRQDYYDHLLGLMQNVDLTKNMQQEKVTVLEPPTASRPAQANLPFVIVLAVVTGVAAGLGIVFVWHLFDDRFVSVRDVKDQFGETVLGLVPRIKIRRNEPKTALLQEADPRRAYWESYRHLRSALLLTEMGEHRTQVVLFTGAMPGEGKTTVAVNLARVLARSGLRVALVDVDPHGGGFYQFLGEPGRPGLLDFLRGESAVKDIVESSEIPGLNFVGAGTHRNHAEGLLLRPQLGTLLEELRKNHDYVILDGAPILAADDAALLVPHADAVVLVMRPFFSHSRLVRQALDMLYQRQARHVAIVFNQARPDDVAGQRYYNGRNGATKPAKATATHA